MPAPESTEMIEAIETPARGSCLIDGCPCKDARFVSHRRAAFFAAMARLSGETADRSSPSNPSGVSAENPTTTDITRIGRLWAVDAPYPTHFG